MSYVLLIHEPRGQRAERGEAAGREVYGQMVQFATSLKERGILLAVESLVSDDRSVRVQRRDRKTQLLDGPFAEAKEMIGGFFLLDCATREEALAIAEQCPAAGWATVEVRETGPCFL